MDLNISDQSFIVCGATSGFGHATAQHLLQNGGKIIAIARNESRLNELSDAYGSRVESLPLDLTAKGSIQTIEKFIGNRSIEGVFVNAGGPPAKAFAETSIDDWDNAYMQLLRWKVELTHMMLPRMLKQSYGRMLFIESASVKQALENLALSTSLRLSVVGMVKTLAMEYPDKGITFNILAPGYHLTPAIERLIQNKAEKEHLTAKQALLKIEENIPMKKLGNPDDLGSLAAWLLSKHSGYITGQVFALDGGVIRSTL